MNKDDFAKLSQSVRQAGKIRRGQLRATRRTSITATDVRTIRHKLGKSQSEFALMIGVSVGTLQNWEQGRRKPEGPAQALLKIAADNPEAIQQALGS
jgi:putative transcriptional regulator